MGSDDQPDTYVTEVLALSAAQRFEALVQDLDETVAALAEPVERLHAVLKDIRQTIKEAREEVHRLSRDEVRKYLAKESETVAQRVREDIKRDKKPST